MINGQSHVYRTTQPKHVQPEAIIENNYQNKSWLVIILNGIKTNHD